MNNIKVIGVVGSGSMGSGIANVFALNGYSVVLRDIKQEYLDTGMARITKFMDGSVKRNKLTEEEKQETLNRITTTLDLKDLADCDLVIEAVIEDLELKQSVFKQLDEIVKPEAILTTNTSSMSITEIASATKNPGRVAGMHFFNPAQIMKLVEVVYGLETSDNTIKEVKEAAESITKEVVVVKKDSPGFIVNRVMIPQFIEAIKVLEEGVASKEDIDKAMRFGLNHPMGAFELQDYAGVDIGYYVMEHFKKEFGDPKWTPPILMKNMMRSNRFGKKTGKGFYDYD